ncbi:PfkB family carbohydrate kinase [Streptomyces sp. NPDC007991]|uniref:PfkB family carbohydrate kinase n=1 Tax=Streptomyces sp. NPDC007991 TaxID=3364803 RepID=UPI0036ED616E
MPHPAAGSPPAGPARDGHTAADVGCLGETMAVLRPPDDRPLADQSALGHRVARLSRVGGDAFGRRIRAELAARGVEVGAVGIDPVHPTGVYFKDPGPDATRQQPQEQGMSAKSRDSTPSPAPPPAAPRTP